MGEDKRLYKKFLDGNNEAFNAIISKYEKNLIYFITRYVKNIEIAQDIYQDTVMYLLGHKEKYDNKYSLNAYLYLIAKSRAINYLNNKKRNLPIENYENALQEEKLKKTLSFLNKDNIDSDETSDGRICIYRYLSASPEGYSIIKYPTDLYIGVPYMDLNDIKN